MKSSLLPTSPAACLSILCALLTLTASAEQFGIFTYRVAGDTVEITGHLKPPVGHFEIPSEIEGRPVTAIGPGAFANCPAIKSVHLPDSVTSILGVSYVYEGGPCGFLSNEFCEHRVPTGVGAFEGCTGLTTVTIPSSVTHIAERAFADCTSLSSVTFLGDPPITNPWPGEFTFLPAAFEDTSPGLRVFIPGAQPVPSIANGSLTLLVDAHAWEAWLWILDFFAETSTDLQTWTTDGVVWGDLSPDGHLPLSVPVDEPTRYLRVALRFLPLNGLPTDYPPF